MITQNQMPSTFLDLVNDQIRIYAAGCSVTERNTIPDTTEIPIENPSHWLRVPDVICVYVDMLGSTKLSAENRDKFAAGAYQLFTGTAVRLLAAFDAPYVGVHGDGVFALFDRDSPYRAVAAAITFKTFSKEEFVPRVSKDAGTTIGCHIGIDRKTVLVRKLGIKRSGGRSDRQNEVWAGKPVNMAAKLAAMTEDNELLASDRFYNVANHDLVRWSCGCPSGRKEHLWTERDIRGDPKFDFEKAYLLKSVWCATHGREFCDSILRLDKRS